MDEEQDDREKLYMEISGQASRQRCHQSQVGLQD